MTEPRDTSSTRPISVAELLAKNGTIGAPPVGGRRRRRRGNTDAVTVAELTGEIPIFTEDTDLAEEHDTEAPVEPPAPEPEPPREHVVEDEVEQPEEPAEPQAADEPEPEPEPEPAYATDDEDDDQDDAPALTEVEADYQAHLDQRLAEDGPIDFAPPPRRPRKPLPSSFDADGGAEQMSPDPVVDDDEMVDLGPDVDLRGVLDEHADDEASADRELPSYLRSNSDTLFGGQSVADDAARRGPQPGPEDIDLGDDDDEPEVAAAESGEQRGGSAFLRGLAVVAQCVLAVAFGAGLFIAFDQLWGWNPIVALVLSVLVIIGLVVGVRVVRKTEDIGSTLIAVAVGALVTLGPLALLQSH